MKTVKKFFAEFDMFSVPPTLRANQEPENSSLCSGITSFLLGAFFTYVFIINVVAIVTYARIDSIQTQSRMDSDELVANDFFFAFRVGYLPFEESMKYFEVGYYVVFQDKTNITYQMQQCTQQQWVKLGTNYQKQYNDFLLFDFYCPKPGNKIDLKRLFYDPKSQYVAIYARSCTNNVSLFCQDPITRDNYIENLKEVEGAIFVNLYLLDEAINPNSQQPVSFFLNTDPQFAFTKKRGVIATIQLGTYVVTTDKSVMPVEQIETKKGNFLHSFRQTSIQIESESENFIIIYISLNRKHIQVQRKVGKLDDMLSYAGGLFSIITGFLGIFIVSYNKYRYQLLVAEGVFHEDQDGNKIRQNDFTFFKYIKYSVYDWLVLLFCVRPTWHDCGLVENTRDEANKQMDVRRLFRKIQGIQFAIGHLIEQRQRQCLALLKPQSLGKIKRNRLILDYYHTVIEGKQSLNFEEYRISLQILRFGLSLIQGSDEKSSFNNRVSNESVTDEQLEGQIEIEYDQLQNIEYLLEIIPKIFPQIVAEADQIILSPQEEQIQLDMAEGLFQLKSSRKQEFLQRVPIKILYRLAKRYKFFKSSKDVDHAKKRKRVSLNFGSNQKVYDFSLQNNY